MYREWCFMSQKFWTHLDDLIANSHIVLDRPKGSAHPRFPTIIYPLDYGYLTDTSSGDGEEVDVWLGSLPESAGLVAVITTVDLFKRDVEPKLLIRCSNEEIQIIVDFLVANNMGVQLVRREED